MSDAIYVVLGLLAMVAFIIFIATPGGMENGDIAFGEGIARLFISGAVCGGLLWVIEH